jgi:hypothetical protein
MRGRIPARLMGCKTFLPTGEPRVSGRLAASCGVTLSPLLIRRAHRFQI